MNTIKSLAYAVFFVFLCIAPIFANAQDGSIGRLIDVPDVENDTSKMKLSDELRGAIGDAGHIVFDETEMRQAARSGGVSSSYWLNRDEIAKLNKKIRHDAIVRFVYQGGKKPSIVVYIYNAYTGDMIQDLERKLKKKKLTKEDKSAIARGVNMVVSEIVPIEYPEEIEIRVTSTPDGATVMRNGQRVGTTPYLLKMEERKGASEQWTISMDGKESVTQLIALDKTETYSVILNDLPNPTSDGTRGKVTGGTGRPIFWLGFNVSPTIRKLDSSADDGTPIAYKTQVFPEFSFDVGLFPFGLASTNQYLQGLGVQLGVGFGFLDSTLVVNVGDNHECTVNNTADGSATVTCNTSYIRFNADLVYRLLLQKKGERLNPNGLALDFVLGFNLAKYTIDTNPIYTGHDYTGMKIGAKFMTPLGLNNLRFDAGLNFYINGGQGDIGKLSKWGSLKERSWGLNFAFHLLYDMWRGIYAQVGYSLTYMYTDFGGVGCLDRHCLVPKNAESKDMYHEIMLGLGYMLY
ncbi:MAG: PEGA domain-containing protein [Proteobacteria bacterium]|nr:PEGA domain-containing protein [Pseudomonadota bacterium]